MHTVDRNYMPEQKNLRSPERAFDAFTQRSAAEIELGQMAIVCNAVLN